MSRHKPLFKLKSLVLMTTAGAGVFGGLCVSKGDERFYNNVVMPLIYKFPPEMAHNLAVSALKYRIFQRPNYQDPDSLRTQLLSLNFDNPLGIAAGFDKHGEAIEGLTDIGFGFVEIGSVTPEPQPGNPKPRVFRLIDDKAIINRYGFNSDGHSVVFERLSKLREKSKFKGVLGVNLGKNKISENAIADYVKGIEKFGPLADYLVINISSPNTPGLRSLQSKKELQNLLTEVVKCRDSLVSTRTPILLKLAPDLTTGEKKEIAEVLKRKECRIDGLIISNTTIDRSNLKDGAQSGEAGGLSGTPINHMSTKMIAEMYKLTGGQIPIIGVGGITTGQDAFEKITAGASLVQIYTSFAYHGPPVVTRIKKDLNALVEQNGYKNISEAVGKNCDAYLKKK